MKKVKYLIPVIGVLFLTGCSWMYYARTQEFNDEFKDSRKVISRVLIKPEEKRTEVNYARIIFERTIKNGQEDVKVYFVISRSTTSFRIEDLGYLKASDKSFELPVDKMVTEFKSRTETSVSSYSQSDSTGVRTGFDTDIDERVWIDDKFTVTLSPEMITDIKDAEHSS